METDNTSNPQNGQKKQTQQGFDLSGLDLSGLLPPGVWDALKPFITSGVMAGGIYLFLIKPLKDKIEAQSERIDEMKDRLDSQKEYILKLETRLDNMDKNLGSINDEMEKKSDLFETRRRSTSSYSSSSQSSGTNDFRKRGLNL